MNGPARQWYLQLLKKVKTSWTELMEQFRIQYCGKGVSMASRYYHAMQRPDETPLDYLYRLNVAGLRANIPYADGTTEAKREHAEHIVKTLSTQGQELASRLTLMDVPDSVALEKKLRARHRGMARQRKTLFGSNKFRQKAPTPSSQPARVVHAIFQAAPYEYDSGRESHDGDDRLYDQDEEEEERTRLFVTGLAPPAEAPRRNLDSEDSGRDRHRCLHLRDERPVSVYAYVAKKSQEVVCESPTSLNDNTCESNLECTTRERAPRVSAIRRRTDDEFAREPLLDEIDLQPGERRGDWKHYAPHKWYKQAKIHGKLDNRRAVLLLDTGAEVSIVDTTFAREVGCLIDTDITQECVGLRDETYYTVGRAKVKITLAGNLVYYMHPWVGDLAGQQAILGMNFMVPAGVRIDTADGTACLPDEVPIQMIVRRPLYGANMHEVNVKSPLRVTNVGDSAITLDAHKTLAWWTPTDVLPRARGFVQLGSRHYQEWQNLDYGATCDADENWVPVEFDVPMVKRPTSPTPRQILRPKPKVEGEQPDARQRLVSMLTVVAVVAPKEPEPEPLPEGSSRESAQKEREAQPDTSPVVTGETAAREVRKETTSGSEQETEPDNDDTNEDDAVLIHEGSDLFAEDLESEMALLPDLSLTAEVKIDDLKVGTPDGESTEEVARQEDRLRQIIWKRLKWLVGKGKRPAARGRGRRLRYRRGWRETNSSTRSEDPAAIQR
ncbi:hypothetical protein ON010_g15559 [Phytophthora cinnamomi]|nr:hypothetical protein ON010_g15559 [Phytophthora cinnamomi]